MEGTFGDASRFNQDISRLEHSTSDDMGGMFSWGIFERASAFNQDIGSWDTSQVTSMDVCLSMLLRSTKTSGVGTHRK